MASVFLVIGVSFLLYFCLSQFRSFSRNLGEAKRSGFVYVVSPVYILQTSWMLTQPLLLPILKRLPATWTESWLPLSVVDRLWHQGYTPYARAGVDTFIIVSASRNVLWTCDPQAILRILNRQTDFPKAVEIMTMLNVYGPALPATEGTEARIYRKIASPSFNEETHQIVWSESLEQTEAMLSAWLQGKQSNQISQVDHDMARLTLHVISQVCFGKKLEWANEAGRQGRIPAGHSLSYSEAISTMANRVFPSLLFPRALLRFSPLRVHKEVLESFSELRQYMEEMRDETLSKLQGGKLQEAPNLLESLVQAGDPSVTSKDSIITPAAVLGNIFVFILAGHETSANTLTFILTLLACHPDIQRAFQADLDRIFGSCPPQEWSYKTDFPALLAGYAGAIVNEISRLYTVLPAIGRTTGSNLQTINLDDRTFTIPADTIIFVNTSATHRHPKYWPASSPPQKSASSGEAAPFPVSDFRPSRWLSPHDTGSVKPFRPVPGSFIPFSDGPRSCLGRRFAQIELCVVLARIFSEWNVELAVEGKGEGEEAWNKARKNAEKELTAGVGFNMALKMVGKVDLKIVRRGKERGKETVAAARRP